MGQIVESKVKTEQRLPRYRHVRTTARCVLAFSLGLVTTWIAGSSVALVGTLVPGVIALAYRYNERGSGVLDPMVWVSVSLSIGCGMACCALVLGRS